MKSGLWLKFLRATMFLIGSATMMVFAGYPPTLKVPVTFYDFKADGSNPEFQVFTTNCQGTTNVLHKGMVANDLGADSLPKIGPTPWISYGIERWFKPWSSSATQVPKYDRVISGCEFINYAGMISSPDGKSFQNIEILDTLIFQHQGNGVYKYQSDQFFPLDGKGFGNAPFGHNYSFTMKLHWKFTMKPGLTFNFIGDDDVWVFINRKLKVDLGGIHYSFVVGADGTFNLDGSGLTNNQEYPMDFFYCERQTSNSTIEITTNIISTLPDSLGLSIQPSATIIAGQTATITPTITSKTGTIDSLPGKKDWIVTDSAGVNTISNIKQVLSDGRLQLTPTRAPTKLIVIGTYTDPINNVTLKDTVYIHVVADVPAYVSIENDSTTNLYTPQRRGTITIGANQTTAKAYAFLRDRFDNLCINLPGNPNGRADQASWNSRPSGIATVSAQSGKLWMGNITKITTGSTYVIASDSRVSTRPDSVQVVMAQWYPIKLRLMQKGTSTILSSVNVETDSSIALEVQGQHSDDTTQWSVVDASWSISPNTLLSNPNWPSAQASSTTYGPTAAGSGTLTLTHSDSDSRTPALVIPVTARRSPPNKVTFTILSPADSLIAGQPIRTELLIRNDDGPVPGNYCFKVDSTGKATFWDPTGTMGRPADSVTINQESSIVNQTKTGSNTTSICFTDGIAQPTFVLHYAPDNSDDGVDSTHQLNVVLGNRALEAKTETFILKPGPIADLRIENYDGSLPSEPVTINANNSLTVFARSYDRFGNKIGNEPSTWSTTGTLHSLSQTINTYRVYYDIGTSTADEAGRIRAFSTSNATLGDSIQVKVVGTGTPLALAITRDKSGNGYLDGIELHFKSAITWPADFNNQSTENLSFDYNGVTLRVKGVTAATNVTGTTDSVFYVSLIEDTTTMLQTAWTPRITLNNLPGAQSIFASMNQKCTDGAGPVIKSAVKVPKGTRAEDVITVTFSERVFQDGKPIALNSRPIDMLNVYMKNGTGWDTLRVMLDGINNLTSIKNDSTIEFKMANGKDLTINHYMNISTATDKDISDQATKNNFALVDNRIVKVRINGIQQSELTAVPNPVIPDGKNPDNQPGQFNAWNEPQALRWATSPGGGGVALQFSLQAPNKSGVAIKIYIKIYDMIGNMVHTAYNLDMMRTPGHSLPENESSWGISIYWNGFNSRGMPCAPGVYRAVVYLDYSDGSHSKKPLITAVGIGR